MPVFAQYTFEDQTAAALDSAAGNGAQDGIYLNGATAAGGLAVLDGQDDLVKIYPDDSFQMATGTLDIQFTLADQPLTATQTVLSRDSVGNTEGGYSIDILADGSILITHETATGSETFGTAAGFAHPGDRISLSYSWDQAGAGGALQISNQTTSAQFSDTVPNSLTMDMGAINQPWAIGAGQSLSEPGVRNDINQHFAGTVEQFQLSDTVDNLNPADGIVRGTSGGDRIDAAFVDPFDMDRVDNNDAILPGDGPNDDRILAGDGNDTVTAGLGDDSVEGGAGNDNIFGGVGNDTLFGGSGNNSLAGDAGDDFLVGGNGADVFSGGAGNDTLVGDGSGSAPGVFSTGDLLGGGAGDDVIDAGGNRDTLIGGSGADTLNGNGANTIYGDNTGLGGTPPAGDLPDQAYPGLYTADTNPNDNTDLIFGGDGNSLIFGGDDADTIFGGTASDSINGGVDDDSIFGGLGSDVLYGSEGDDTIDGAGGDDTIYGDGGTFQYINPSPELADTNGDLVADNNRDQLAGGAGADVIYGGDDDDTLSGGDGSDRLSGGLDDDAIAGDAGNDNLSGDQGNDTILGGQGADTLAGGDDRDTFAVGNGQDGLGDVIDGNEGGDDFDTLDLSGSGPFVIHYDQDNRENGRVDYLDSNGDVSGTLTFSNIENVIPCFTPGTLIATPKGEVAVESLKAGDRIITRDNGIQEIRWVGRRDMGWRDLAANPHLMPVMVRQGSLGNGLPERDMMVSPNHRLLVANDRTALYFDEHEVLVAAKHLIAAKGVKQVESVGTSYIHFMFDLHEVVLSNGAWTESFQPGDYTLKGMGNAQRSEIFELFPELQTETGLAGYQSARRTLKRHEAVLLVK